MVYLHHDGKGGEQLGTSAREHDPSYVLKLDKPKRPGLGPSFAPREYVLEPATRGDGLTWTLVEEGTRTKAELILEHASRHPSASASEIAAAVKTTEAHVRAVLSKARRRSP